MSVSRRLVPGQTQAITRRTAGQCRFFNPREGVRELLGYVLGRALELSPRVRLHAYSVNTTHPHVVVTDTPEEGKPSALPDFFRTLNSLTARAMNARFGRGGALFCAGSYDNVEVHGEDTLEDQLLYAWTNVTKDGLVASPDEWPGLQFLPDDIGQTFVFAKPEGGFFGGRRPKEGVVPQDPTALSEWKAKLREKELAVLARMRRDDKAKGRSKARSEQLVRERWRRRKRKREEAPKPRASRSKLPPFTTVTIHPPPGFEGWPIEEVRRHHRQLYEARNASIHAKRAAKGLTRFKGLPAILAEDPRLGATDTFPTFGLNPRIACKDRKKHLELRRGLRAWRREVREKWERWRRGERDVVFPRGTYGLGVFHGALVEGITPVSREQARPPPQAA